MKKRMIIPFVFAMSLGVSAVHAEEVKTSTTVQTTVKAKVEKPQQLKDLQAEIKSLRSQKQQLNVQIKTTVKAKLEAYKQQVKAIKTAKDKTKAEKKLALTDLNTQLATFRTDYKAYSSAVGKLWEDRKSKWEAYRGYMKNKEYDVAIKELQTIKANLTEAISLKQQFLAKVSAK